MTRITLIPLAALALAACATTDPPEREMGAARAMVSQARPIAEKDAPQELAEAQLKLCLLYTSPSPRDLSTSRMPSSA